MFHYRCGLVNFWAVGRKNRPAASVFADSCREVYVAYSVPFNATHETSWSKIPKSYPYFVFFCAELACRAFLSARSKNIVHAAFLKTNFRNITLLCICWPTWILLPAPTSIDLELIKMIEAEVKKRRTTVMLSCVL